MGVSSLRTPHPATQHHQTLHSTWHHLIRHHPTPAFPIINRHFQRSSRLHSSTEQNRRSRSQHLRQSTISSVELTDVSDFDQIVSPDCTVSICGFGSLLSGNLKLKCGALRIVTVFEIQRSEIPSFIEREHKFHFLAVLPATLDGNPYTTSVVLCARYSDGEYFQNRCKGSKAIYYELYGRFNIL